MPGNLAQSSLVKAVTQAVLLLGVTAFTYLSADFESMLMPRSGNKAHVYNSLVHCYIL